MRARRFLPPLVVGFLSLGFLGQGGTLEESSLRHISSCEDASWKPASASLPTSLFSYIQDDSARQAATAYSLFLQTMQVNASLFSLSAPSMYGYPVPLFPNYAVPVDHYVDPNNLPQPSLAWGGMLTDPSLQYLIHPTPSTSAGAPVGSLDALVDLPVIQSTGTIGLSVGATIKASPLAAPTNPVSLGQALISRAPHSSQF